MERPQRITTEEVMWRINRGEELVFVDVRTREDFRRSEEMIGGATRVPPDEVERHVTRLPGNILVLYCSSPQEATSEAVARDLLGRGFERVRVLDGGLDAWKRSKGFVVAKTAEPERVHQERAQPRRQQTLATDTGVTKVSPSDEVPREGVGAGHVVETPMSDRPSAHRKQPDEATALFQDRLPNRPSHTPH